LRTATARRVTEDDAAELLLAATQVGLMDLCALPTLFAARNFNCAKPFESDAKAVDMIAKYSMHRLYICTPS